MDATLALRPVCCIGLGLRVRSSDHIQSTGFEPWSLGAKESLRVNVQFWQIHETRSTTEFSLHEGISTPPRPYSRQHIFNRLSGDDDGGDRCPQRLRKVAIIGAGPSGTSAAFFLKRAQDHLQRSNSSCPNQEIQVTIYERNNYIGGRTTVVYPHDDDQYEPIELGASIYADVNYNLRRAVKEFQLETGAQNGYAGQMGVWDGQQFLFEGDASSWWTSAKFFLRYGYSAVTAENLVKKQLSFFSGLYDPAFLHASRSTAEKRALGVSQSNFPWHTIEELAQAVNVSSLAATTGLEYFKEHRVSELFIEEMIEAATRVNYAQDSDQIHGFGALVSLAASGATGVKDGNYRIFEEFFRRSGAKMLTGKEGEVTGIVRFDRVRRRSSQPMMSSNHHSAGRSADATEEPQWYIGSKSGEGDVYDAVVIATPWHNAGITLLNTEKRVKSRPFVHLHVTLLATTATGPKPAYFGLGSQDAVPRTILTSDESVRQALRSHAPIHESPGDSNPASHNSADAKPTMLKKPHLDFFSLNYLRPLRSRAADSNVSTDGSNQDDSRSKEHVVKIFSNEAVSDELLDRLFGSETITWLRRHEWDSYPLLEPTTHFPNIQVDENLYYSNAMESLVSTMETSTVSARNTVALLLKKWYGDAFVNGQDCKFNDANKTRDPMKNPNWAGWGCDSG
ncbi:hypothetical protein BCV70DRAFT_212782 [Testicularia cyperi]|uniref:Prenylcysteine lyase domain-containing protein n=1 Tax=Testicularia cyperi TaxID=1882483 RepID=A0A317XJH9_9BASI|nr:hypothetical protein BCV70DRAFT_212782 [Testicularia cyperi]